MFEDLGIKTVITEPAVSIPKLNGQQSTNTISFILSSSTPLKTAAYTAAP